MANTKPSSSFLGITSGVVFLAENEVTTGVANVDFENFTDAGLYGSYVITCTGSTIQTSQQALEMVFGQWGGSSTTWDTASSYYYSVREIAADGTLRTYNAATDDSFVIFPKHGGTPALFTLQLNDITQATTAEPGYVLTGRYHNDTGATTQQGLCAVIGAGTEYLSGGSFQSVRFQCSSGNITAGHFRVYGITNS